MAEADTCWRAFARAYLKEMGQPAANRTVEMLAALSHHGAFSVGCYCEDESHCHRSVLRTLLQTKGADLIAQQYTLAAA